MMIRYADVFLYKLTVFECGIDLKDVISSYKIFYKIFLSSEKITILAKGSNSFLIYHNLSDYITIFYNFVCKEFEHENFPTGFRKRYIQFKW